ncbi:butyrate kinase [Anoxynatronum buryatiense]|uniref:Probable butyrate kinase n=1 Tax=Anoxynatronum buryatiense TaxID=489973 RepID=A0AA45WSM2_9CLOT|nr:butyrate kinase [Anoxynatronum buryatiense]SMP38591.1 butyrate kinase [Anoxynatronum buryatiense]
MKILAINPGSTSTKIALYDNEREVFQQNLEHTNDDLAPFKEIADQYQMRKTAITSVLEERGIRLEELKAVVGRGGILPPVKSGAYRVNEAMVDRLRNRPLAEHASNLGGLIAYEMAESLGIPSFIYDSVAVDEFEPIARISGLADIKRKSLSHALNMRAAAIETAKRVGKPYRDLNLIVAHLGGGITVSVHHQGRMVDIVSDDEGPFSPERAGRVPCMELVKLCYKEEQGTAMKKIRGKGGLISYLNTNSALEVEKMIAQGNDEAKLVYEAMAYQIAKAIGELATVVEGKVDRVVITGGIAYSEMMTGWIQKRVEFIAPVELIPGENELRSLALGALRVLKGEETALEYDLD